LPRTFAVWDMLVRMALDLTTAAAAVHVASLYGRSTEAVRLLRIGAWVSVAVLIVLAASARLDHLWWWTQAGVAGLGMLSIAVLSWAYRGEPHPLTVQLRRFGIVALGAWTLLTLLFAMARRVPDMQQDLSTALSMAWYITLATLLLLVPLAPKLQHLLRELSVLVAISAAATSLNLLFVGLFSLGKFTSLSLSLFLSIAAYSGARRWILKPMLNSRGFTTEQMFDQVFRIAREVEAHPLRMPALLLQLLSNLFDPLHAELVEEAPTAVQVLDDGSTLLVPVLALALAGEGQSRSGAVRIRFAQRGRHVFSSEDARLTDRIVEHLRRAVGFAQAVEQGRSEERLRLAQDLHDDIGARLLTLMYKAHSPEMEEYVRHTLKDLKTLTRGLAATSHTLSHAAAEWKADLAQRLIAADVEFRWSFTIDRDIPLSVVQWSALTRILRELVSNVIAHANARRVDVALQLEGNLLDLSVTDNGNGLDPCNWSHGLGLGGVRKRVKQLDGEIEWREAAPTGIDCRVRVPLESSPG